MTRDRADLPDRAAVSRATRDPHRRASIRCRPRTRPSRSAASARTTPRAAATPLELAPARVHVHSWEVLAQTPTTPSMCASSCGGGTYVRALARDLGRLTGQRRAPRVAPPTSPAGRSTSAMRRRSTASQPATARCGRCARRFRRCLVSRSTPRRSRRVLHGNRRSAPPSTARASRSSMTAGSSSRSPSASATQLQPSVVLRRCLSDSGLPQLDRRRVVTVGTFDGVHRGHRDILRRVVDRGAAPRAAVAARDLRAASAARRESRGRADAAHAGRRAARGARRDRDRARRVLPFTPDLAAYSAARVRRAHSRRPLSRARARHGVQPPLRSWPGRRRRRARALGAALGFEVDVVPPDAG